MDEFIQWYCSEPRLSSNKIVVTHFRIFLENRNLAAGTINGRLAAVSPLMAILRNPGLRPYLDNGVQRSYSYDFVESYGDNWRCADWGTAYGMESASLRAKSVAFLSSQAREAGERETKSLLTMGGADACLGSQGKSGCVSVSAPERFLVVVNKGKGSTTVHMHMDRTALAGCTRCRRVAPAPGAAPTIMGGKLQIVEPAQPISVYAVR